jgi:hypothetical protein
LEGNAGTCENADEGKNRTGSRVPITRYACQRSH